MPFSNKTLLLSFSFIAGSLRIYPIILVTTICGLTPNSSIASNRFNLNSGETDKASEVKKSSIG